MRVLFGTAAITIVIVVILPFVHGSTARIHEEVAHRCDLKTELLCDSHLHLLGRSLGLLENGLQCTPLYVGEYKSWLLGTVRTARLILLLLLLLLLMLLIGVVEYAERLAARIRRCRALAVVAACQAAAELVIVTVRLVIFVEVVLVRILVVTQIIIIRLAATVSVLFSLGRCYLF